MSAPGDVHSGLVMLDARCSRGLKFPDLTIVDARTYVEVLSRFQPQQRFLRVVGGTPTLAFMGGSLYPEAQAESRTALSNIGGKDLAAYVTPLLGSYVPDKTLDSLRSLRISRSGHLSGTQCK